MRILDGPATRAALPVKSAIEAMNRAMTALGRDEAYQPPRVVIEPPHLEGGLTMIKPAGISTNEPAYGLKVLSIVPSNPQRGLETIQGFMVLFDLPTGVPRALLEGAVITEVRTGAVSAVATDLLAREDAKVLALIGAGPQARSHLQAIREVRSVSEVRLWNRTRARAEDFRAWAAGEGVEVEIAESVEEAVSDADIVCTVTASREPLIRANWLAEGTHINAVGAFKADTRELASDVVAKATVFVDSRDGAMEAGGDLLIPIAEGVIDETHIVAELSDVLTRRHPGRTSDGEITLFKSLGLAVQDVAAAVSALAVANQRDLGVEVSFL